MRSADVLQAFPGLRVSRFAPGSRCSGKSVKSIILAVAFVNTPILPEADANSGFDRFRQLRYVEAAYVAGASDLAILRRHVHPQ